ncbi:MAG: aminopeptidase P family protein [Candidatus Nanopelagicaceae bacterium]
MTFDKSNEKADKKKNLRPHDIPTPEPLKKFMEQGWAPSPLDGLKKSPAATYAVARRERLSKAFPNKRLVIPAGTFKVRSNDSDYRFRPHSAFAWLTGINGTDAVPESVLVLEPNGSGHESLLFIHPRSVRENSDEFYRNPKHGEFWIGRRMTLEETEFAYDIKVKHIDDLEDFLSNKKDSLLVREQDSQVDELVAASEGDKDFLVWLSEARLIKDKFEIDEMQRAVDATHRGFEDMIKAIPGAVGKKRGERLIEGAFFTRARFEGNDLGYDSIVASGSHACILHWIKNDGELKNGDLVLIDAGVEVESLYTADITRTLPINGKFTPAQRKIYTLVYEAQKAGMEAVKPGAKFRDFHHAAMAVLAKGLEEMGVLPISAEESLKADVGLHRRWTVHGTGHMLGMDVHDCAQARKEAYTEGILEEGMIVTVEPGFYIHPDDTLFPAEYRGIGVRIEDDVLVTKDGYKNLSSAMPRHPDEIEAWVASLWA